MSVSNQLVKKKPQTFSAYLAGDAIKRKVNEIVGGKDGQRFITAIISAVSTNPDLAKCDYSSILSGALLGESLKLSPSPQLGQYYLVPFDNKKRGCKVATFVIGYKGLVQLAIRSGQYKKLNVLPIKAGELIRYDPLNEEIEIKLIPDWDERQKAETIGYYAMFELTNGFRKVMYWSKSQMMAHADRYSPAFKADKYADLLAGKIPKSELWKYSSFWYKDFDMMAQKTMLRQLLSRWSPLSIEMQSAIEYDMAEIREDGSADYVEHDDLDDLEALPPAMEDAEEVQVESVQTGEADQVDSFFDDLPPIPAADEVQA